MARIRHGQRCHNRQYVSIKLLRCGEMVSRQSHKLKIVGSIPTIRNQI